MTSTDQTSSRTQLKVAAIGAGGLLLGTIATAVMSNWDRLFYGIHTVEAPYSKSYRPTGNFETEMRYFFEVSGTRKALEDMTENLLKSLEQRLSIQHPADASKIANIMNIAREEQVEFDDILKSIIPVYKEYYTIEELQELNKFYSTEIMQSMIAKQPLISAKLAPTQAEMLQEVQSRILRRIQEAEQQENSE